MEDGYEKAFSVALVGVRANEKNYQRTNLGGDANISILPINMYFALALSR
jgi:hypothetical protein